ncbi:MAG: pyridoxamine 5'-phosphate oxidase family protein [Methanosarcinaceae archaeon]|nr:pyridoxamine 5'-phosphate oxidase family protein [Methanosarcinaceae archaeon]
MVKMPADVKETIEKQKPIPIATASADGTPNVALVGLLKILDDETILIANNYFKKTEANIIENPKISFVVYDAATKKAFQIKGSVELVTSGKIFEDTVEWVHSRRPDLSPKSAAIVHVEEIYDSKSGQHAGEKIL